MMVIVFAPVCFRLWPIPAADEYNIVLRIKIRKAKMTFKRIFLLKNNPSRMFLALPYMSVAQ
jgi:hypothetical protein